MKWLKSVALRTLGRMYVALGGDTLDLTRRAMKLLTSAPEPVDADNRVEFLKKMTTLADSKELEWVCGQLVDDQAKLTFEHARNLDEINLARGTSNGLLLLQQRLNSYKNEYEEMKTKEDFDKFAAL